MAPAKSPRRTRVERGVYRQPNGNYAVCARRAGRLHFRTCGHDLEAARRAREELVAALASGKVPASPRLRFDTVAGWWLERFEAKIAAGERHFRTLEAHRYHLDHNLLPRLASRRIAALGVEDVAALITELRAAGRSAKSTANALGTLQGILRFARRRGWVLTDPVELLEPEERPRHPRRRQRVLGHREIERLLDACPPKGRLLVTTAPYRRLISCEVEVTNVLDLRVAENRDTVGLSILDMTSDVGDYEACHRVARAAHQLELHGIIAPAATGMGETLALFERRLSAVEQPILLDTLTWEGLPADPRRAGSTPADAHSSGGRDGESE